MIRILRPRKGARQVRWILHLLGGIFLGMGLLLWGQAEFLAYVRNEVQGTFFLFRWIGKVSFIFMSADKKVALALADIPPETVRESVRWAQSFLVAGAALVLLSLFTGTRSARGRKGGGRK